MTPTTMEAPAEAAQQPTADSILDEAVGLLTDDGSQQESPAEGAPAEEVPGEESPAEGEQPTEEEAQPDEAEGQKPAEGAEGDYPLSEDGKSYVVPKEDWTGIKAQREYAAKVQEWFPTPQHAEVARKDSVGSGRMWNDIQSGTPQSHEALLHFLNGMDVDSRYPDLKAQVQANFLNLVDRMPGYLEKSNPEAHARFVDKLIKNEIKYAYDMAAKSGNKDDFLSAQRLDYGWNGQYLTELPKAPAQPDAVDARLQELNSREAAMLGREWTEFDKANLEPKKWGDFYLEVDRVLSPFKDKYSQTTFNYIRQGIVNDVRNKLLEDKLWADEHSNTLLGLKQEFERRWRAGQSTADLMPSIQAFRNDFMLRAKRFLPSIAKQAVESTPPNKPGGAKKAVAAVAPGGQPVRAQNGQFQKPAPPKNGMTNEQRINKTLDEIGNLIF